MSALGALDAVFAGGIFHLFSLLVLVDIEARAAVAARLSLAQGAALVPLAVAIGRACCFFQLHFIFGIIIWGQSGYKRILVARTLQVEKPQ